MRRIAGYLTKTFEKYCQNQLVRNRFSILGAPSSHSRENDMNWRQKNKLDNYNDTEVEQRLKNELPQWYFENGWIRRKYKTSGWKSTLMLVNTIGHISEAGFHHPDLAVSYAFVIVKLKTHSTKGITNKDFELATKLEQIVMWQPDKENGALEGIPDDQRFKYIKYD